MDGFEINKIIAAVLATVLIVFSINKFADILFHAEKPQQSAYKVEEVEATLASASSGETKVEINELLAMGTIEHGEWQSKMNEIIGQADIIIGKQRHGPTGNVKVEFEGIYTKFKDASKTG